MSLAFKKRLTHLLVPDMGTLVALFVAVPAALSLHESFDLMFNISTGKDLLQHGFPLMDPFSITASSPWFPHEWGYSVLSALSVDALGGTGPAILIAVVLSVQILVLWRLLKKAGDDSAIVPLLLVLVLWAQDFAWNTERAYHLGHLMFVLGLYLIFLDLQGRAFAKWLFVPLLALWANLHGSWVVGPALLGSYALGRMLDNRRLSRTLVITLLVAFMSFLAAAASPEGLRTCLYPLRFLGGLYNQEIAEWHPMDLANGCARAVLVLMLLSTMAFCRSSQKNWAIFLPALGLTLVTIVIERFSPFSSMAMALYLVITWKNQPDIQQANRLEHTLARSLKKIVHGIHAWNRSSGGGIWVVVAMLVIVFGTIRSPKELIDRLDPSMFPVSALKELRNHPPGKVFNTFRLGGAVSAIDGPQYKVFIDSRSDLFPPKIHQNYKKVSLLLPGWKKILDSYDPDYLLWSTVSYGSGLLQILKNTGEWRVLAEGPIGVLWQKKR